MTIDRAALLRRILGGEHPWGSFDSAAGRYGVRRRRLVVYPPGTQTAERCRLRLWRSWSLGGAVSGFLTVMVTGGATTSPARVILAVVIVYLVVSAVLLALAGKVRTQARSVSVTLCPGEVDVEARRRFADVKSLAEELTLADRLLSRGVITAVEHEVAWWQAYDRVAMLASADSARTHGSNR